MSLSWLKLVLTGLFSMQDRGEQSVVLNLRLLSGEVSFASGFRSWTPAGLIGLSFCPYRTLGAFGASFHARVPYLTKWGLLTGNDVQAPPCMHLLQRTRYMLVGSWPFPYFFTKKKSLLLSSSGLPVLLESLGDHMQPRHRSF